MALRRPVTQVNQLATVRTERAMRIVLAPLDRFSALRAGINACRFLVAHGFLLIAHGCFFSLMAALSRSWLFFLSLMAAPRSPDRFHAGDQGVRARHPVYCHSPRYRLPCHDAAGAASARP